MKSSDQLVGESQQFKKIKERLTDLAPTEIPVLITGETGTGKEIFARRLHDLSRREGPFIVVDCGALPTSLMEEELFGHERGAYTGADGPRLGLLQAADNGTVFLDEIGELRVELQTRLLRAIDRGAVRRIGSNRHISLNVRFVSATNRDLLDDVVKGKFRRDLFFRLAGFTLSLPPLRERADDITLLLRHFLRDADGARFSGAALACLGSYDWPGNVRELQLFVDRVRALVKDRVIEEADVRELLLFATSISSAPNPSHFEQTGAFIPPDQMRLRDVREAAIKRALLISRGDVAKAATLLGIGKSTIYAWLSRERRSIDVAKAKAD